MNISRREFFIGALSTGAVAGCQSVQSSVSSSFDPNLSVFLSDIHISGWNVKGQPTYQNPLLKRTVDEILLMRPLPQRVVVFGDVALWHGRSADYEVSRPELNRLEKAGIKLFVTTGNHDHREPMFRFYPEQAKITPVPGRFVSVIDLGSADLLLIDTLNENPQGEGSNNIVSGTLDEKQQEWLKGIVAKKGKRPYLVGCHHPSHELKIGKVGLMQVLLKDPDFIGFVHGHDHRWIKDWHHDAHYSKRIVRRKLCLPSTGWWGDIGYSVCRTTPEKVDVELVQKDFFFPKPLNPGEKAPADWLAILEENRNQHCIFPISVR